MSTPYQPQEPRDARARAKADKAYAKASRPWYKKKRVIIPAVLVGLVGVGAVSGGGSDPETLTQARPGSSAPAAGGGSSKPAGPAFGTPVEGSKFTVTVRTSGKCKGATCTLESLYENTTGEPQTEFLDRSDYVIVAKDNRRFEALDTFDTVDLQPGAKKRVVIKFTGMPTNMEPARLEADTAGTSFEISF